MRIGLLEDDVATQEMVALALQDEGYTVISYSAAEDYLAALGIGSQEVSPDIFDVLMIDWRLGCDISGVDVIQKIRNHAALQNIPIILTTAAPFMDNKILKSLQIALLEKPFSVDNMVALIQQLTTS